MIERASVRDMLYEAANVLSPDDLLALWRAALVIIGAGRLLPGDESRVTLALRRLAIVRPAAMDAGYFLQVERGD